MNTSLPEDLAIQLEKVATQVRAIHPYQCECDNWPVPAQGVASQVSFGFDEVRRAYNEMQDSARTRVDAFDQGPHHPDFADQCESQPAALERGVTYRVVYDPQVLKQAPLLDTMWRSMRQGEKARVSGLVPARLLVRDNEEYLVLRETEDWGMCAVRGDAPWILDLLERTFEAIWAAAAPVRMDRLGSDDLVSDEEREIIALLGSGLTDESIARRLNVSLRTVQRKVQAIQRRIGASSRFQLGAMTADLV